MKVQRKEQTKEGSQEITGERRKYGLERRRQGRMEGKKEEMEGVREGGSEEGRKVETGVNSTDGRRNKQTNEYKKSP
ncbi:hypothetical protein DPMN_069435 [Dreissena polymorpha]|uniref:Uncharacterized protein n=1 Tax=Dreissena polymorpha TaxID=45954 RepID=A0A9D4BUY0_DREPO|nr:hypothetical protein DPMN_069435 [Dreissena polymorpha]